MRRLASVGLGVALGLYLFLLVDLAVSPSLIRVPGEPVEWLPAAERPYLQLDHGWYELKKNFRGRDYWGANIYDVQTDEYGFRMDETRAVKPGPGRTIVLGDSFSYGINGRWEETFVGMLDRSSPDRVLNAAVPSYSPTPHLYRYSVALSGKALAPVHNVILVLDISDVHDEAGVWVDGAVHPYNLRAVNNDIGLVAAERAARAGTAAGWLRDRLRFTRSGYQYVRYSWLKIPNSAVFDQMVSAFTWSDWPPLDATPAAVTGFSPLGVAGGLDRIRQKAAAIAALASASGGRVYLMTYPWPAQLVHADQFDWPAFVRQVCTAIACAGVIDAFPAFRDYAKAHRSWYPDLYVNGDVHLNPDGNRLVFDQIRKVLPP